MPEAFVSHFTINLQEAVFLERLGSRIPLRYSSRLTWRQWQSKFPISQIFIWKRISGCHSVWSPNVRKFPCSKSAANHPPCVLHEALKGESRPYYVRSSFRFNTKEIKIVPSLKIVGTRAWRKPQTPLKLISGKTSYSVVLREQMCGWGTSRFILGKPKDFVSLSTVK